MNHVALIIAAYNAEKTIARAVRSALAEAEVAEVIVVDDASTDATVARAKECDDGTGRLKVVAQSVNRGPSAARNVALSLSAAPWVGVLDSDDFILPGRTVGLLSHAEGADMVADDMWQVGEHDVDGPRRLLVGAALPLPRDVDFKAFVEANMTRGVDRTQLGFIKPIMRRAFLDAHAIRYKENMRLGEDYELYARALAFGGRLRLVPAQGYVSVVRAGSLSSRHGAAELLHLRDCDEAMARDCRLSGAAVWALRRHYLDTDCRLQWLLLIEAVKTRNVRAAVATFLRPWPVPLSNAKRLLEQIYLRSVGKLTGRSTV